MKNIKIIFTLLFAVCISTVSKASNNDFESNLFLEVNNKTVQQEKSYTAYVQRGNDWVKGVVYVLNGYVTKMSFPSGSYSYKVLPTALNPNNPMAIQNNFTHYVDVPNTGRAFFILN